MNKNASFLFSLCSTLRKPEIGVILWFVFESVNIDINSLKAATILIVNTRTTDTILHYESEAYKLSFTTATHMIHTLACMYSSGLNHSDTTQH